MGHKAAHHWLVGPWAAKWPMSLYWGERPQSGPSMLNAAKGRKGAHHCEEKPISGISYTSEI